MQNQTSYVGDNVSIACYELITGTIPYFRWLKWKGRLNVTLFEKYVIDAEDEDMFQVISDNFNHPTTKQGRIERSVIHGSVLTLKNITSKDSGYYTCLAINLVGTDYVSMYLNVIDRQGLFFLLY